MSNCFICNQHFYMPASQGRIKRGNLYYEFSQVIETVVSVVDIPNQDSAHDNTHTNNYVTYRINGFHYKGHLFGQLYDDDNDECIYIVFFKVKITNVNTLNIKRLSTGGDFSDFILYKQPNDVIDYRCLRARETYTRHSRHTREIDVFCNKTFLVKPDDVFGIYYLVLGKNGNLRYTFDASVSVYFDVV